ncbi:MAG: VWA domain-containing protein [Chloroflexi bacterium]|nr:VWA domain-containing protein [Chloroflexota bacterium]
MKRRTQKGQSLLEFALVLPILLIIISGIVDMGHAMLLWSNLSNAAREGSRYGAANPGDTLGIIQAVRSKIVTIRADDVHVAIAYDDGVFGHNVDLSQTIPGDYRIVVTPSYSYHPMTPFINRILPSMTVSFVSARTIVGSGGESAPWQDSPPTFAPLPTPTFTPTTTPNPGGDVSFATENLSVCIWDTFNLSNYVQVSPVGTSYTFYYEQQPGPEQFRNWHLDDFNAHRNVTVVPDDMNGGNQGTGRYRVYAVVPATGEQDSVTIQVSDCGRSSPTATTIASSPTPTTPAQCQSIAASDITLHDNDELRVTLTNNASHDNAKITRIYFVWPTSGDYPNMKVDKFKLDDHEIWEGDDASPPTDVTLSGHDDHREIEHGHHKTWKAKIKDGPEHLTDVFNLSSYQVTIYFEGGCAVSASGSSQFGPSPTPESTAQPSPTPVPTTSSQCSGLTASQLVTVPSNKDHVQTTITNGTDEDAELDRIVFYWPESDHYPHMKIDWFKLGGHRIWGGDGHSSPTDVSHFSGDKEIKKNHGKTWEADFDHSPSDLASYFNMGDFVVTFYFENGCSITTSGSGGSQGPESTPTSTTTPSGSPTATPTPGGSQEVCYVSPNPAYPGQGPEYFYTQLYATDMGGYIRIRLVLDKEFVDNTYGANTSEYWKNGRLKQHTFQDLWKSDRAQFLLYDGNGSEVMDISVDYLDVDGSAPSGYASQGVTGGDGSVNVGNAAWVLSASTSLDYNLNSAGYSNMTTDSPATDANYTPNPSYPNWLYEVIYTVDVDKAAFGQAGFDHVTIPYIHASPSRVGQNTVNVQPGPCAPPAATSTPQGGATSTPTSTATPTPTVTATPTTSGQCEIADIAIGVQPTGTPFTQHTKLDVMIVLDRSGSMDDAGGNPPQPISDAKSAAKLLIDQLDSSTDKVGLVSYSTTASKDHSLTNNFNSVKNAIDNFNANGYTNIGDAVYKAQQELNSSRARSNAIPIIVVLSDGVANRRHGSSQGCSTWPSSPTNCTNDAINQAASAKNQGTTVFTIGLNLGDVGQQHGSATENLARNVLRSMASDSAHYYEAPNSSDLAGIFQDIGTQITQIIWKNVVVTEVLPADLQYVNGSANPSPASVNGQTMTWNLGNMKVDDSVTITLSATVSNPPPSSAGTAQVSFTGSDDQTHVVDLAPQITGTRPCP